jgi:hypothetical protein
MHGKQQDFGRKINGMNQLVDGGNTLKQISNAVNRGSGKKVVVLTQMAGRIDRKELMKYLKLKH